MRNITDYFSDNCNYQPLFLFLVNKGEVLCGNVWNTLDYLPVKTKHQRGGTCPNNKTQQTVVKSKCSE
jgi:hypothetical protein